MKTNNKTAKAPTYTYDALVNSKRYSKHEWAARAALEKGRRYTLEEADKAYYGFLDKEVR